MTRYESTAGTAPRICGAALAALALLAAPAPAAAQMTPKLENLRVEIWPEFDRPSALVILKGELAADTKLPAPVSLRIPAPAGRPAAVAFSSGASPELFNLQHETSSDGKDITVRFSAPQRFFHVEYYDPIDKDGPQRNYSFVWRGDLPVNRLTVSLQEPAGATGLSVLPALGAGAAGPDGLTYRTAGFGPLKSGEQLVVALSYRKADARTTADILNLKTSAPPPAAGAGGGAAQEVNTLQLALVIAGALAVILALALAGWWLASRRSGAAAPAAATPATGFCTKCGNALAAGDRFCSACGKPVGNRKNR